MLFMLWIMLGLSRGFTVFRQSGVEFMLQDISDLLVCHRLFVMHDESLAWRALSLQGAPFVLILFTARAIFPRHV